MHPKLRNAFEAEMRAANREIAQGCLSCAQRHLETAHVLGQAWAGPHVRAHWGMLRVAIKRRAAGDAWGQMLRIVLGAIGSAIGLLPDGNTGSSKVSMFKRMPVHPELAALRKADRQG